MSECTRPPEGWHCFQPDGHDGPCPAVPCPWPDHQHGTGYSDCWVHYQSEKIKRNTYVVCFECGHVWTRFGLWRAWIRGYSEAMGVTFNLRQRLRRIRGQWLTRPSKIYFCPECVHDF